MANLTVSGVRFMYNFVFEPRMNKMNGKEEYFVRVLVPKDNIEAIKAIKDAIHDVATDKWGAKADAMLKTMRVPLMDGDVNKAGDEVYKGMYYFNAKTTTKPSVVDLTCNPIMNKEDFYSGCWGAFNGQVWAYDNAYGKGISISLGNLMKMEDDEHIGGSGISAREAFAAFVPKQADNGLDGLL